MAFIIIRLVKKKRYKVNSDNVLMTSSNMNSSLQAEHIDTSKFTLIILVFLVGNRSYSASALVILLQAAVS